jgi:hypothetical protein
MATKNNNDDFDMPEWSDDLMVKAVPAQDQHLGPAVVKPLDRGWAEQHGPQPLGAGLRTVDFLIIAMFAGSVVLFVKACSWAITFSGTEKLRISRLTKIPQSAIIMAYKAKRSQQCRSPQQSNKYKKKQTSWAWACWKHCKTSKSTARCFTVKKQWKRLLFLCNKGKNCLHRLTINSTFAIIET